MTQPSRAPRLRAFTPADLPAAHVLSVEVGWPHRPEDLRFLVEFGRGVVACDEAGQVNGCAFWWPFGEAAGAVGMVIVTPRRQGGGLGRLMMRRILDEAGPRALKLFATSAGRRLYEREGFVEVGTVHQRQGIATLLPSGPGPEAEERVRRLVEADWPDVLALDATATGSDRREMLAALARRAEGCVAVEGARVTGFAFTRPFGRGHVVGPLVAGDDATAMALLRPSLAAHRGTFLRADTPVTEGPFARILEESGLVTVASLLAMARGGDGAPAGPARIYCLAAQALG